ncbi:MAG: inorganic diphosphatase, partial [Clostridia bacterium]|nr:inorganic diphosphatase [Clostridia bacterium]
VYPMTLIRCYPIGAIKMTDNDENDEKIIAIPFDDPNYNVYNDIAELPNHIFEEMAHFFTVYKALEHKKTAVQEIVDPKTAVSIIEKSIEKYNLTFGENNK